MKTITLLTFITLMHHSASAQDFWVKVTDINSNSFRSMGTNSLNHIFIGSYTSGALRSTDNGVTWVWLGSGWGNGYPSPIGFVQHPNGDMFTALPVEGTAAYRSSNNGEKWIKVGAWLEASNAIAISPKGVLYVGTDSGVYCSGDTGKTWIRKSVGLNGRKVLKLQVGKDETVFAGTNNDLYRLDDGGDWKRLEVTGFSIVALVASLNNSLFIADSYGGSFRSSNNGETWESMDEFTYPLATSSSGVIYADRYMGVERSIDFGNTWENVNSGLPTTSSINVMTVTPSGFVFAANTQQGEVYRSRFSTLDVDQSSEAVASLNSIHNYPNPFSSQTTIQIAEHYQLEGVFEVRNVLGQIVCRTIVSPDQSEILFDGSTIPNGMYVYTINDGKNIVARKMMIVH